MNIYHTDMDILDSFEAYYKNVILKNNNIIIPYINIGVKNHPLNSNDSRLKFLNYCYAVYRNVNFLDVFIDQKRQKVIGFESKDVIYHAGGVYLDFNASIFNDMAICCEEAFLQTLEVTKASYDMWIPFDSPDFSHNTDSKTVDDFFAHKLMPNNIQQLIK